MAELVAMAARWATAAMGDSAAMARSGRPEQLVRHPVSQASTAQSAEQAVAAGLAEPVAQFQATAVSEVLEAMAELEATAEPASQARPGRIRETLAKPAVMEGMEPLAEPEGMVDSEARPLELGLQGPEGMEARGEMRARLELAVLVGLAQMAPLCPALVAPVAPVEPEELELTAELEELEGQARLVVEPAVVWAWRRPVETAALAARAELDLMRADFRMDRLVVTLARAAPAEPAARPARWAQMQRPLLAVLAVRAAWVAMAARAAMAYRAPARCLTVEMAEQAASAGQAVSAVAAALEPTVSALPDPMAWMATAATAVMAAMPSFSAATAVSAAPVARPWAPAAMGLMALMELMATCRLPSVWHPVTRILAMFRHRSLCPWPFPSQTVLPKRLLP
jgi:hypothetical protein